MAFLVSRTDTSQFVLTDAATDTVIIDDDLAVGFAKLERTVADKPIKPGPPAAAVGEAPAEKGAVFSFRGGPRYTPVLLAVVLPFAWLAVLYLALANLLSEHALDRNSARETHEKIEELEREVQSLRSEISGAPRAAKQKPKHQPGPKQTPAAGTGTPGRAGDAEGDEPEGDEPGSDDAGAEPPAAGAGKQAAEKAP